MGEISAEVFAQLSKGISEVIKTEFGPQNQPLISAANVTAAAAESIIQKISTFNFGVNEYRNVKEVVDKAATQVETDFAITGIKTRMDKIFAKLRHSGFSGDHSHSEDEQLLSILKNKKIEMTEEVTEELLKILKEYFNLSKDVAKQNRQIYANAEFKALVSQAEQVMRNGYQILAKIGEAIGGTNIVYEVQVSVKSKRSQRTAYMTLEQIMQFTTANFHNGEMRLRLNEPAINQAVKNGSLSVFYWDDAYRQSYQSYVQKVQVNQLTNNVDWDRNKGVTNIEDIYFNRGNITEAFRRAATGIVDTAVDKAFLHTIDELESMEDTQEIHYLIHTQIQEILQNTVAFWQGPDFEADISKIFKGLIMSVEQEQILLNNLGLNGASSVKVQEKVSGASFAGLNQIATQLRSAAQSLLTIINNIGESNIQSALDSRVVDGIDEDVEQAMLELIKQFLPGAL